MTSKAQFIKAAESAGCSVEYGRAEGMVWLTLWAPDGQEFKSSSCSCDASFNQCTTESGASIDWPRACAALAAVLTDGFQESTDA